MSSLALWRERSLTWFGPLWPYAAVLVAIFCFSFGTATAKGLFPVIGPEATVTLRVVFSALLMAVIHRPWKARRTPKSLLLTVVFGLVLGMMNLTFYMALRTLPVGIAVGIEFMGPLTVALIGSRRLSHVLWVAMAVGGLALLLPIAGQSIDPVGAMFAAIAGVCWALYIVLGQKLSGFDTGRSLAIGLASAALVVLPVGAVPLVSQWHVLTPAIIGLGMLVAILSSALPYSLEMAALRHIPKRTFGVMLSLDPAVGALAGLIMLHEQLSLKQWLAIGLIVAASVGAISTGRRRDIPDEALAKLGTSTGN